jgi:hypothetical protein
MLKTLKLLAASLLLLIGLWGAPVSLFALADPVGTKMADDLNPYGPPPSRAGSAVTLLICLSLGLTGGYMIWSVVWPKPARD